MKIINNQDVLLIEEIKSIINDQSTVYLSCNHFTSFAFFEIIDTLKLAKQIKVLLSVDLSEEDDFRFIHSKSETILNHLLDRKHKINQVLGLIEDKIEFRKGAVGNQNLLLVENAGLTSCYALTPMDFDSVSLGELKSDFPIFINAFDDTNNQYLGYFNQYWNNSTLQINDNIVERLEKGTKSISAEAIYKYSVKEIFSYSSINERADEKLEKIGLKSTKIWSLLYNFQKDAVIGAIEKIEKFGGCIIADSVGLGKTFEAVAVIKYYDLLNKNVLVLAPKKLRDNWTIYTLNDRRNILSQDRLRYDVLNHTDLSRERGKSGDMDLETINWGAYDLVVIDESHNFRNNPNTSERMTRYKRLMDEVVKSSIRTKVLMLSATPVNNKMNDLKNQIAFISEGNDNYFAPHGIDSITQVMRDAQRRFTNWYKNNDPNNLDVNLLMENLDGQYFRILDMLTIARSRKHINKYYDTADIGNFPIRLKPITLTPDIDTEKKFHDIGQIYDEISMLTLASYTPLGYVRSEKRDYYEERYDIKTHTGGVFKQVDREQSLIYLMRVNLLKRLESSIHSFRLTLGKLVDFVDANLKQIEQHKNGVLDVETNITDIDIDDSALEDLLVGGKTRVLIQDIDIIRWKQDLKLDKAILVKLMNSIKLIDESRDAKLMELKRLIDDKVNNPINPNNKKVIVFTAFADTANYLYKELQGWIKTNYGLNSALVTGSGNNKTNMPNTRAEISSILTHFSPRSKKRDEIYPDEHHEIDFLFCTDCISEGQNLQDCDYLVNYDIHWNPVRIIQRFGRIDRIGSINEKIQLVNFFPNMELDSFIDLIARVKGRMVMLDVSATGEDNIISQDSSEMQDLDYRKRQLIQLQDKVMDLEDVQGNISITDLTFNDFKVDIEQSTDEELLELKDIPVASYAVVKSNLDNVKEGVIYCLKDSSNDLAGLLKNNLLYPFFLVYISNDGQEIVKASQTKLALDYFRKLCMGNDLVLPELVAEFDKETKGNKKMEVYTKLLKNAINEIVGVQEEVGLSSLARAGGTVLVKDSIERQSNLELISYLIIK